MTRLGKLKSEVIWTGKEFFALHKPNVGDRYLSVKEVKELMIKMDWIYKFVPFYEEYGKDERITKEVDDEWDFLVEEFKKLFQKDN